MSLKDLKLEFSDKQAVTGTSASSTNTLDLGLEKTTCLETFMAADI